MNTDARVLCNVSAATANRILARMAGITLLLDFELQGILRINQYTDEPYAL